MLSKSISRLAIQSCLRNNSIKQLQLGQFRHFSAILDFDDDLGIEIISWIMAFNIGCLHYNFNRQLAYTEIELYFECVSSRE